MALKKRSNAKPNRKRTREDENSGGKERTINNKNKPMTRRERVSDSANSQLRLGVGVLILAIIVGYIWNRLDSSDPRVRKFFSHACRKSATCAPFVIPARRTLQAARPIRPGEVLVEIPREMQFWSLDALRDEFVEAHLLEATHRRTENQLPAGAYLAAWLAMLVKDAANETNVVHKSYLEVLPTFKDLSYHPILWDRTELRDSLSVHSLNYAVALNYREMVESEYDALVTVSPEFGSMVNATEYRVARINVLTRSFSPGPVGPEEEMDDEEFEYYRDELGIDLSKGCHAMVPILDMLNHHPNPNVGYSYSREKRSFIISAKKNIPAGWELMDSYGKYSDSHLFGKFGFVNGDGSGFVYATIALFHRSVEHGMSAEFSVLSSDPDSKANQAIYDYQRRDMRRYLQYDDGYKECIRGPEDNPEAFQLKKLKLEHLVASANNLKRWVAKVSPRAPKSEPVESSEIPITEEAPEISVEGLRMDITGLVNTCRLMSLIESDMGGRAIEILTENLGNEDFEVEKSSDELEYRALMCIARLSNIALVQYTRTVAEETENVARLTREEFGSRNWTTAQLRLGEMQTLQLLSNVAFSNIRQLEEKLPDMTSPAVFIRQDPCPREYLDALDDSK